MFRRILIPVDGTAGSEKAVPYAVGLAQALDAEVVICHVINTPITPTAAEEERAAARYATKVAERIRSAEVAIKTQVRRGDPPTEIKKAAVHWNADAIVMATRGRQRVEKLVLGSVADAVVRDSHLPVLLVSSRQRLKRTSRRAA